MPTEPPNRCKTVIESIDDYFDGDRESDEHKLIEKHLLSCSACKAYFDNHRDTLQLTRAALQLDSDDTQVPEGMIERILGKIKKT